MHPKMQYTYVGIDSHRQTHTAVFLNCFYEKLGELVVSSTPSDFEPFFKKAEKFLLPYTTFCFAFEDISLYGRSLVKFLISKEQLIKHTNANLVASERKSRNDLQKTDSVDAECCARVVLSQFEKCPTITKVDDKHWILKTLVAHRQSLSKTGTKLKNQLHQLVFDNYPTYHTFFGHIDTKTALAFFETYPSPAHLKSATLEELTIFILDVSKGSIKADKANHIWESVQNDGVEASEYQNIHDFTIQSAVRQLRSNIQEMADIEEKLENILAYFDYPLTTMKGVDTLTACRLVAEIGDIERFQSPASLARYAGIAPATYSSGETSIQYANKRGNRQLNTIFHQLAIVMISTRGKNKAVINPYFYDYYMKKIGEGKTKKQALKSLQRRLVNIIWGMMKHKEDYINPPIAFVVDDETGEIIEDETINDNQKAHLMKLQSTFK